MVETGDGAEGGGESVPLGLVLMAAVGVGDGVGEGCCVL